jgi:hypothetical protein
MSAACLKPAAEPKGVSGASQFDKGSFDRATLSGCISGHRQVEFVGFSPPAKLQS